MAKILKRGNNIEAGRRGAGGNGHLGDAFSTPGLGRAVNSAFPDGCVLLDYDATSYTLANEDRWHLGI
jgi:hypothetical protein